MAEGSTCRETLAALRTLAFGGVETRRQLGTLHSQMEAVMERLQRLEMAS